ncbi:hypothetical protein F183_A17840 [Bryobacterales bacterium F-183]|nr:hypothetical protein F183_A17840 [Bryobacterales bacterium F-183]
MRVLPLFLVLAAVGLAERLTIEQMVEQGVRRYPAVRVPEAEVRQAAAGIQLARTAYLPKIDAIAGVNRATRNNSFGLLLPSQIIAPISGPVLGTNGLGSAFGSTVGVLATWEPFDFGLRDANVAAAEAAQRRANAGVDQVRLQAASLIADSALTWLAAVQTAKAAQAGVDRAAELQRITEGLVNAELRAGAESSLAAAEAAAARLQLVRSKQAADEAKAVLSVLLNDPQLELSEGSLLRLPGEAESPGNLEANPSVKAVDLALAETEARLHALDRAYFPKFSVQATSYARGTGAVPDGRLLGGVNGLGPNIQNWGVGFTATFPVFDLPSIRAKKAAEVARLDADKARREQLLLDLKMQQEKALAAYRSALEFAQTTPVLVTSAKTGMEQIRARYEAGLATALEVAEAQRRLTQAEIDDSLARLSIWRARLAVYVAAGDLAPFLREASR